jgi:hypothetical protein
MADNPRGLLSINDELSSLNKSFNRYRSGGAGPDRENMLSTWSGTVVMVDRKNLGDPPLRIYHPCLSVVGGIQDHRVRELGFDDADGLAQRFLCCYPEPRPVPDWSDVGISPDVMEGWAKVVRCLRHREMPKFEGRPGPYTMTFSEAGYAAWRFQFRRLCEEMNAADFHPVMKPAYMKLREYAGRIVLVLTLMHHAAMTPNLSLPLVEAEDVARAWKLVDYFKAHALRVQIAASGGLSTPEAMKALNWLRENRPTTFRVAELKASLRWLRSDPLDVESKWTRLGISEVPLLLLGLALLGRFPDLHLRLVLGVQLAVDLDDRNRDGGQGG